MYRLDMTGRFVWISLLEGVALLFEAHGINFAGKGPPDIGGDDVTNLALRTDVDNNGA